MTDLPQDPLYVAHCYVCGAYVDDWHTPPPVDLLCDGCEKAEEL